MLRRIAKALEICAKISLARLEYGEENAGGQTVYNRDG